MIDLPVVVDPEPRPSIMQTCYEAQISLPEIEDREWLVRSKITFFCALLKPPFYIIVRTPKDE